MRFESFTLASLFLLLYLTITAGILVVLFTKVSFLKFNVETSKNNSKHVIAKPIRWVIAIIILLVIFWMDFARDYTFKNLNMQMNFMYAIENGQEGLYNYTDSLMENILGNASSTTIYYLKFTMTCVFTVLYFSLTTIFLKLLFPNQRILPYTFLFYSVTFCSMGLFFVFNSFPFSYETSTNFYLISMEVGHLMQSSLPTLLFVVLFEMQSKIVATNKS
jgi:hypothetical protein